MFGNLFSSSLSLFFFFSLWKDCGIVDGCSENTFCTHILFVNARDVNETNIRLKYDYYKQRSPPRRQYELDDQEDGFFGER